MAPAMFSLLQSLWPFSLLKTDDIKISTRLLRKLSIPEQTKQFVFAFQEPDTDAVLYILAVQNLSEQSALDAECLIKEVKPKAVVAQIAASALNDVWAEEKCLVNDNLNSVPTSSFEVLRRCFIEKINKNHYENFAGSQVLQEIFGIGFYGHFLAAKRAAEETGSHFVLVQSPYEESTSLPGSDKDLGGGSGLGIQSSFLVPGKVASVVYSSSRRLCINDPLQLQLIKMAIPYLDLVLSEEIRYHAAPQEESGKCQLVVDYNPPSFAQSVYPLLQDLHDIFVDLPSIEKALVSAQKMLVDVSEGKPVDTQMLSDLYSFRTAVEFLRLTLNNAGRRPIDRIQNSNSGRPEFFDLPAEEQSHILFAQTLKNQVKKFGSVVAIVDAGRLTGLRRHWNTTTPPEVAYLVNADFECDHKDTPKANEENEIETMGKRGLLADKPVVAVSAGATAVLGASSLSKVIPASTFFKLATYKIPASLNFGLAHLQRLAGIGLGKILGSSKILAHGVVGAGTKSSAVKFTASAEKIRVVMHTVIASAERTSLLAMRTSFYEIMQRRHMRPFRLASLATFTGSVATCTGLLLYGDGIECAAESVPSIPMIASLGRGLESLHQASVEIRQTNGTRIQEALHSLMYKLKKMRVQVN